MIICQFLDVWSAGCVLAELLLGQPIFPGDSGVDQLVEIIKVLGTPTRDQIKEMNPNYTEFKFPQIKSHPWQKVRIAMRILEHHLSAQIIFISRKICQMRVLFLFIQYSFFFFEFTCIGTYFVSFLNFEWCSCGRTVDFFLELVFLFEN